jgi:hypothetical protein
MAVEDGGIIGHLIGRLNHELLNGVIPPSRRHESINAVPIRAVSKTPDYGQRQRRDQQSCFLSSAR